MNPIPAPDFSHIRRMSDGRGTFEHALYAAPRPEHGYCTDDMARLLVVATRQADTDGTADLAHLSLSFVADAQSPDGACRNRMDRHGAWEDQPALEDAWGRSVWALGSAAGHSGIDDIARTALDRLVAPIRRRSPWPRAMAFAALGAAELLSMHPAHAEARALLADAADAMALGPVGPVGSAGPVGQPGWPWPEPRLTYANAVLPEAMIAAGAALDRPLLLRHGLDLLAWLVTHETKGGHLSPTPVGGAGPGDVGPNFDQQPIEVAALADACARASRLDDNPLWGHGVAAALGWFLGDNDAEAVMWDPLTGGSFDGLQPTGVNRNQGTESTLALLSTLQHARRLVAVSS